MRPIERILSAAARVLVWVSAAFLALMALHVCADVVLKYFFNRPIPGTAEIVARYYMLAAVFLPLAFVELRNTGIAVDLFYNMCGSGVRRCMIVLALIGQTVFFVLLAYQSGLDAMKSLAKNEFIDGQIAVYIWPSSFFLPIGFWLAAALSVVRLVQALTRSDWEQLTTRTRTDDGMGASGEVA